MTRRSEFTFGAQRRFRFGGHSLFLLIVVIAFPVLLTMSTNATTSPPASSGARTVRPIFYAPPVVVQSFSVTGGTPSGADNDYTRINNAVLAASAGAVIELQGTFDWTELNAAASWALGSDGTGATGDDFSILVPQGLNSLTITAGSLGAATIEGPGDLPAVNLEAFLVFDGGDNQNLLISNLRIRNFDLSIGMFGGAGGTDAFNGTLIQNNYILVPSDLNATDAPADVNQNIGIHFAFGQNQTISGNTIDITGGGVTLPPNAATSVGMQSNTSGGSVYDGLIIDNNTIRVLSSIPPPTVLTEGVLGIWENAHGHTSNITVSNNHFINAGAVTEPGRNAQTAFRVTSHSSLTTTVVYSNNTVDRAGFGFLWNPNSSFSLNEPVRLVGNVLTDCATGFAVQSSGRAHMSFNRIVGTGRGVDNTEFGVVNAENNWWGCNAGPGGTGCTTVNSTSGAVDFNPWLVLNISAAPASIGPGQTSSVTASFKLNSDGTDVSGSGQIPDGTPVAFFGAPLGTMTPPSTATASAIATSVFTAGALPGTATISATVDSQTVFTNVTITGNANFNCVQDDSNRSSIVLNRVTGDYLITRCNPPLMLTGRGTVRTVGCSVRLEHFASDRRVTATIDTCQKRGTASVQTFSPAALFTITDRNTANNTCACP
jgi:hypothetical protein